MVNIRPAFLDNLLTYLFRYGMRVARHFRVNMDFINGDQIFKFSNLYIFKDCVAKDIFRNFHLADCGDWTNIRRSYEKLARWSGSGWSQTAWTDNNIDTLLFFLFCNIHTQTGYYKKGICHSVENCSQLQCYHILLLYHYPKYAIMIGPTCVTGCVTGAAVQRSTLPVNITSRTSSHAFAPDFWSERYIRLY